MQATPYLCSIILRSSSDDYLASEGNTHAVIHCLSINEVSHNDIDVLRIRVAKLAA